MRGKAMPPGQSAQSAPTLSALDVNSPAMAPRTQPAPASVTTSVKQDPPPIETVTPDSLSASAVTASASAGPQTRPAVEQASPSAWNKLLTDGSTDGSIAPPATQPIITGQGLLADAKARRAAGQIIEARAGLNDALQSGKLSDADLAAAQAMLADINQTLVFSAQTLPDDAYAARYLVKSGESLTKIAIAHNTSWELLARINHLDPRRLRSGSTIKVIRGPFFAVVRKKSFAMDVYLGGLPGTKDSMYVKTFAVGLGKDDSTPTGLWSIAAHAKLRHPTYYPPEGGNPIDADDPANPLGGYWIALTGIEGQAIGRTSYGIHGTIDPASIGHQASMGCIRLSNDDIAMVFDLMVEGQSKVLVE
jgi:lipoprotein-anchoring transpeptidase ErfK/SrfK